MSNREQGVSAETMSQLRQFAKFGDRNLYVGFVCDLKRVLPSDCRAILAALKDAALLDALERSQVALAPVEGNIMPAGTWCVDPPGAVTEDDVWMGQGVRGALRAAFTGAVRAAGGEEQ
jgi:hypothetical protein